MASAKTTKKKNIKATKNTEVEQAEEEHEESVPTKVKKPIEIDEPEPLLPLDEKVEDPTTPLDEEAEANEEEGIAEDDIDPFGDKWEL